MGDKGSPGLRGRQLYHADSVQEVAERLTGAAECEIIPGDLFGSKQLRLQTFLVSAQIPADRRGRVDHDDHGGIAVGVDVDEAIQPDLEPGLLARLTPRRGLQLLAAIDEAAGEYP